VLAPCLIEEVRRLLAEGKLSQRKIARATGVSRGVVDAIAAGKRPDYEGQRPRFDEACEPAGPPARCPECGGKVYLPCRLCEARRAAASSPPRPPRTSKNGPLVLDLKEEHRRRYEQVRARRIAAELAERDDRAAFHRASGGQARPLNGLAFRLPPSVSNSTFLQETQS
jgi:transcriptional regulator with XRE-family HTH domain